MKQKTAIKQAIERLEKHRENLKELDKSGLLLENEFTHKSNYTNSIQLILSSLLPIEEEQIKQSYGDGLNSYRNNFCNRDEYFEKVFGNAI